MYCADYLYCTTQVRILAYGKGEKLVESFSGAATAAKIRVVAKTCPHFSANLFSRANYLPEDALVGNRSKCRVVKVQVGIYGQWQRYKLKLRTHSMLSLAQPCAPYM